MCNLTAQRSQATAENSIRLQFQQPRISLNEFNSKSIMISLVSYTSVNMATIDYLFTFNQKICKD